MLSTVARRLRSPRMLLAAAIVLTALNLRPAVTSVGALLRDIQAGIGMTGAQAGVLTTVPVVCFGVVGLLAARFGRRLGTERAVIVALLVLSGGLLLRPLTSSPAVLIALSLLGLSGIAIGNVLLPVVVKERFPDFVGRVTGLYAMGLAVGTAAAAGLAVPVAQLLGGWRAGLGFWAAPALVATLPWLLAGHRRRRRRRAEEAVVADARGSVRAEPAPPPRRPASSVRSSPQAWGLAFFFGLQSMAAYIVMGWLPSIFQDAGISPAAAGWLLALTTLVGAPIAVLLPELAARRPDQRPWVVGLIVMYAVSYLGLMFAPAVAPVVWSLLLGIGMGAFPLALVMIGLRAATNEGTAQLSSLTQGVGYLVAAGGPVAFGALHDATGGWRIPLSVLMATLVPMLIAGLVAARAGHVDVSPAPVPSDAA